MCIFVKDKRMRKIILFLVLLIFSACSSPQVAAPLASPVNEIVVSNATQLASAMSTAINGTTITMRGGTYTAPASGWQFANGGVTLRNFPGEQVILNQARMNVSGNYIIKCLQSSLAVDGNKIIGSDVNGQKGIVMQGVTGAIAPAILAYKCDGWEIAGVEFRNVGYAIFTRKVDNGDTSADRWYVHDNFVSDYYRESGMQFNGNSNRIENNVILKATSQYTSTFGCQVLNLLGNNNIVRGNHLERVNQSVRCIGIFFEWDLADANLIENNTIAGVVNGVSFFGGDNNVIRNNTLTGTDTAFILRSWADGTTAYPCNFSAFMPLESDTSNPDWGYMYPHDCRSKGNRFEGNAVSGFRTFSQVNLPEASNIFVNATSTHTPTATQTNTPIVIPPTATPVPAETRMLIPLYTSPTNWGQVISANVGQVIDVIINPNNGVGASRQTAYANGIASLQGNGINVFGYVATGYGARNINAVKSEIDIWQTWYVPDGIFLDEVWNTDDPVRVGYYSELYSYIQAKGLKVILNPGAMTTETYLSIADAVCIFENSPAPVPYPAWAQPAKMCALMFNANREQMISFVAETKGRFGYIYATSDTLGNPWDVLPGYLIEAAALIAGLPVPVTSTAPPTTTPTSTRTPTATPTRTPTIAPTVCETMESESYRITICTK